MVINQKNIGNLYAVPKHHPITCANPAPWKIEEISLVEGGNHDIALKIRNSDSMWFNAKDCYISEQEDCKDWLEQREHERLMKSLYFSIEV